MENEAEPSAPPAHSSAPLAGNRNPERELGREVEQAVESERGLPGARRSRSRFLEWPLTIVLALLVALLVRGFLVQQFVVEGSSMVPTFAGGERVLVNRFVYRFTEPDRGDVVVASLERLGSSVEVVKRVVGLPGEMLEVRGCDVLVDDEVVFSVLEREIPCGPVAAPLLVPEGHVYLLGDNRGNSLDSRAFGPVPLTGVVGRVDVVLWPPSAWSRP